MAWCRERGLTEPPRGDEMRWHHGLALTERLGAELPTSGSPARNAGKFETLVVTLSDGARILCTAAGVEVQVRSG